MSSLRRALSLLLAALMLTGSLAALAAEPAADPDRAGDRWYADVLEQYDKMGIDPTLEDGLVHAQWAMGRYDFLRALLRALRVKVDESDPAAAKADYLRWGVDLQLLTPEQCGEEALAAPFCRYEMARMLYTILKNVRGETIVTTTCMDVYLKDFYNCPQEAREAVNVCYVMGILRGEKGLLRGWYGPTRIEGLMAILRLVAPHNRYYVAEMRDPNLVVGRGNVVIMINHALGVQLRDRDYQVRWQLHAGAASAAGYLPNDGSYDESRVGQPLTRREFAVLLSRLLTARGEKYEPSAPCRIYLTGVEPIPEACADAVEHCVLTGVLPCEGPNGAFGGDALMTYKDVRTALDRVFRPQSRLPLQLDQFTQLVAAYTTTYTAAANSVYNSKLAARGVGERVLQPGGSLSFLDIIGGGPAEGYKVSTVIKNGHYTYEYGGGICQTSSTLYAAAVYANLYIARRYNHALRSAYVAPGLDATIYIPYTNLVIVNPYDQPIKLVPAITDTTLTFYVLAPESLHVPQVTVDITQDGRTFYLTRTADGVVTHTTRSYYGNNAPSNVNYGYATLPGGQVVVPTVTPALPANP